MEKTPPRFCAGTVCSGLKIPATVWQNKTPVGHYAKTVGFPLELLANEPILVRTKSQKPTRKLL